jgi:hypothetical protein
MFCWHGLLGGRYVSKRKNMKSVLIVTILVILSGCTSLDRQTLNLDPGMTKEQVVKIMGVPDRRSFRDNDEALQYQGVIGYGQCIYITTWFKDGVLIAVTDRRGTSIAGCGLGSREVDWGQMPTPNLNINVTNKTET